ncbi:MULTISPECIES: SRPBCC family protein [Nocardiopsidaceae]|uniref:SRPBCC family protein n=1 Tax=Streptomonospora nanhaiensis TaxID=1323731 RepID=A0ABY6YRX1_9ACTN|nr:SRPBCC family protein [Streptomonospora nanhaiensis]WAE74871.1 SRPBCC family protein [Streptomonospora nanhaiensis]
MSDLTVTVEPGRQDIVITRTFDAPRDVVFRAMTEPEHLARWWGLDETDTVVDRAEVRPGGTWRFVEKAADGEEYAFHGVFHDVVAPERIVQTFEFEGMPGHVAMDTHMLEEKDGRTLYRAISVFQTVEDRDGMVSSGMEEGLAQSLDALEGLARGLA